ncbi:MAG: serine--tRNA ligase [Patescibacteria group bacterium]|nr:serine--tRNA ligase [Patescibacteria group bacterium]MDD5490457.1 serine--tRNA ligase [Patescibacteria group bacterium]
MLEIKFIRENTEKIREAIKNKGVDLEIEELLEMDDKRKEIVKRLDVLRSKRNELAHAGKNGKPSEELIKEGRTVKGEIGELEKELEIIEKQYLDLMAKVPMVPSSDTPIGKDESENVECGRWGKIKEFKFKPKTHIELGRDLDILDLERGVKVAGYRGYYLKNEGALLVMALMFYAFKKMAGKGYLSMIPPTLIKEFALFGSGYFKGRQYNSETDEIYEVATPDKEESGVISKERKFLVGTSEPSLLAYYSNEVLKETDLPKKFCGFSQCYRSEIGSYGRDNKGIYRVHEFMKVEQVVICRADIAEAEKFQQEMLALTKEMHEELGLPYRQVQICTGDMGAGKYKMFDLEAWMPGLERYGETGSASNFLDWQARRLNVKYIDKNGEKKFVYMLNNTALPSPRIFISILENYQQKDGSVKIPKVLRPYLGFKVIKKK